MTDVFRVGSERASFDGVETGDVESVLRLADDYRKQKAEIVSRFHADVQTARERADKALATLKAETERQIRATQEVKTDG
jgi:hypothetical protein